MIGAALAVSPLSAEVAPMAPPVPPFCAVNTSDVAALHAAVAASSLFKRNGGDALHEIWSSDMIQAIVTFVTLKHPAYPAVTCQQVIERGGAMQIDRKVRCEADAAACTAFNAEIEKAEDGPGDGE